jgi:hypothetical protein
VCCCLPSVLKNTYTDGHIFLWTAFYDLNTHSFTSLSALRAYMCVVWRIALRRRFRSVVAVDYGRNYDAAPAFFTAACRNEMRSLSAIIPRAQNGPLRSALRQTIMPPSVSRRLAKVGVTRHRQRCS